MDEPLGNTEPPADNTLWDTLEDFCRAIEREELNSVLRQHQEAFAVADPNDIDPEAEAEAYEEARRADKRQRQCKCVKSLFRAIITETAGDSDPGLFKTASQGLDVVTKIVRGDNSLHNELSDIIFKCQVLIEKGRLQEDCQAATDAGEDHQTLVIPQARPERDITPGVIEVDTDNCSQGPSFRLLEALVDDTRREGVQCPKRRFKSFKKYWKEKGASDMLEKCDYDHASQKLRLTVPFGQIIIKPKK